VLRSRAGLINHLRGTLKSFGARLPPSALRHVFTRKWQRTYRNELRPALEPLLETLASLTVRIHHYDRELEELAQEHYPETKLLGQVQGVGTLTALSFVLTLEEPGRFEESRQVGAYLGLVAYPPNVLDFGPFSANYRECWRSSQNAPTRSVTSVNKPSRVPRS
jgi:transposase